MFLVVDNIFLKRVTELERINNFSGLTVTEVVNNDDLTSVLHYLSLCHFLMVTILQQRFVPELTTGYTAKGMNKKDRNVEGSNGSSCPLKNSVERSACFFANMKSILPCELSKLISGDSAMRDDLVLIDCQSFTEYSSRHITGAFHVNCTGIVKRRLTQGKLKLHDLLSSDQGKQKFLQAKVANRPVVVYDGASHPADMPSSSKPISLVTRTLLSEGTNTLILQG